MSLQRRFAAAWPQRSLMSLKLFTSISATPSMPSRLGAVGFKIAARIDVGQRVRGTAAYPRRACGRAGSASPFASIQRPSLSREIISSTQGVPLTETYFAMTKYISFRVNSSLLSVVRSANARWRCSWRSRCRCPRTRCSARPCGAASPFASISRRHWPTGRPDGRCQRRCRGAGSRRRATAVRRAPVRAAGGARGCPAPSACRSCSRSRRHSCRARAATRACASGCCASAARPRPAGAG